MAADSLLKASTPEPFSTSKTSNWVAKGGGLPAYVQHIAHDIMDKRGVPESKAIAIAIGVIKRWAAGGGTVDATTRAAAAKALAEWERLKAGAKLKESPLAARDMVLVESVADVQPAPAGALALELDASAPASGALLEWPMTSGQQLASKAQPKTRSGANANFEQLHPRGRGGSWTFKAGAQGDAVKRIQRRVGGTKADGMFGAKTTAAVRAFQRRHGLQVDGVVGAQTAAAMRGDKNAARVKPGALTSKDITYLRGAKPTAHPAEGSPNFNWRREGNRKRGVILKDGSKRVVDGPTFDRLRRDGRLSSRTPKLHGD